MGNSSDDKSCSSDTPRTDAAIKRGECGPDLCRQLECELGLERESHEVTKRMLADAQDDVARLHREKMDALFGPDGSPRSANGTMDAQAVPVRAGRGTDAAPHSPESSAPSSTARIKELEALAYIGEHHFPDLTWKARCLEAEEQLRALRSATTPSVEIDPRMLALIRVLDDLEESGNGWNPATMPHNANDAERKFRDMLVTNWTSIRKLLPIRRVDRSGERHG